MSRVKEQKASNSLVPLIVLGFGFLMIVLHLVTHAGEIISSVFLPVSHPLVYTFPKYNALLKKVVRDNLVDYKALKASQGDLNDAVGDLAKTSSDRLESDKERSCYWINAYNLLTLKAIVDVYPISSIHQKQVPRAFSATRFLVGGQPTSLDEMYQMRVTPQLMRNPEYLFLVCGGAQGYPPLLDHALRPESVDAEAQSAARAFIDNQQNVYYDAVHKQYVLSPLFKWNERLFDRFNTPHDFVNQFLPSSKVTALTNITVTQTFARNFNWWLNDTTPHPH